MQRKSMILLAISVLVAIGIGYAVGIKRHSEDLNVGVVRTYTVPVEQADQIRNSLNSLFYLKDGESYGRAQVFSNGLLLVVAPQGYQQGVNRLVQKLAEEKPMPRTQIHFDYWLVVGQEDRSSNEKSFGALTPALETIVSLDGPRKFKVLEHLSDAASPNQEVKIKGYFAEVTTTASPASTYLNLRLDFHSSLGQLKSDSQLKPGEFMVLGQNAVDPKLKTVATSAANVYYIVRAEVKQ